MRISVFITSYNQKKYLIEAIESVLDQTLPPSQIIIVDDYSNDGSQEVIAGYAADYPDLITPIYHTVNRGVAQTRVDALHAVTGDYVSYVDGDDRYLPTKLEKEATLLQGCSDPHIAFSNNYYMSTDGVHTGVWADEEKPPQGDVFRQTFARDFPKCALFRMELIEYKAWKKIGFHDVNLRLHEDFDMRIRLAKYYRTVYCDEPLSEIRIHHGGLSSAKADKQIAAIDYVYRKNKHLLNDLSVSDRTEVQRKLGEWKARIARGAVRKALREGQFQNFTRLQALTYSIWCLKWQPNRFNYRLLLRLFLPHRVCSWVDKTSHRSKNTGTGPRIDS